MLTMGQQPLVLATSIPQAKTELPSPAADAATHASEQDAEPLPAPPAATLPAHDAQGDARAHHAERPVTLEAAAAPAEDDNDAATQVPNMPASDPATQEAVLAGMPQ